MEDCQLWWSQVDSTEHVLSVHTKGTSLEFDCCKLLLIYSPSNRYQDLMDTVFLFGGFAINKTTMSSFIVLPPQLFSLHRYSKKKPQTLKSALKEEVSFYRFLILIITKKNLYKFPANASTQKQTGLCMTVMLKHCPISFSHHKICHKWH